MGIRQYRTNTCIVSNEMWCCLYCFRKYSVIQQLKWWIQSKKLNVLMITIIKIAQTFCTTKKPLLYSASCTSDSKTKVTDAVMTNLKWILTPYLSKNLKARWDITEKCRDEPVKLYELIRQDLHKCKVWEKLHWGTWKTKLWFDDKKSKFRN